MRKKKTRKVSLSPSPKLPEQRRRRVVPEEVLARLERAPRRQGSAGAGRGTRLKAAERGDRLACDLDPELYDAVRLTCTLERCSLRTFVTEALEQALRKRELAERRMHTCTDAPLECSQ
jgi:hypothetical protein